MSNFFKPEIKKLIKSNDIDGLIKALDHKDENVRKAVCAALSKIGAPSVEPIFNAFLHEGDIFRETAQKALAGIGKEALLPLIDALLHENYLIREAAVFALDDIDRDWAKSDAAKEAVPKFIAALKENDPTRMINAADALVKIGAQAVEPLINKLISPGEKEDLKVNITVILERIGDKRAVEPLISTLRCDSEQLRRACGLALVKIGDASVEPLIDALKKREKWVRVTAASALGKIKEKRAVKPLIEALNDDDPDCKRLAAWALKNITGKDLKDDLAGWKKWLEENSADFT